MAALIFSGVKLLRDNGEIQEALDQIEARFGEHPLRHVDPDRLKDYCDAVRTDGLNVVGHAAAMARYRRQGVAA